MIIYKWNNLWSDNLSTVLEEWNCIIRSDEAPVYTVSARILQDSKNKLVKTDEC